MNDRQNLLDKVKDSFGSIKNLRIQKYCKYFMLLF